MKYSERLSNRTIGMTSHEKAGYCLGSSDAWSYHQEEIDELQSKYDNLQKKLNDIAEALDAESSNSWGLWKEKADMLEQGASNAYEKGYWMVKEVLDNEVLK